MLSPKDKLTALLRRYVEFILGGKIDNLKPYLPLDFVARQKIMQQLKFIQSMTVIINGSIQSLRIIDESPLEELHQGISSFEISPFQFIVVYESHYAFESLSLQSFTLTLDSLFWTGSDWQLLRVLDDLSFEHLSKSSVVTV